MKAAIVTLVRIGSLTSDAPIKELTDAAHAAEDRSLAQWSEGSRQRLADRYRQDPAATAESIEALARMKDPSLAVDDDGVEYTPPTGQPAWTDAVKRLLTPEQLAVWQAKADEEKKDDRELERFLDAQVDSTRENFALAIKVRLDELQAELDLPPERAAPLEALGQRAVAQALKAFRATVAQSLRAMSPGQRRRIVGMAGNANFGGWANEGPGDQEVWKAGLDRLLTPEDRQRLGAVRGEREARRAHALGRMLLVVLDEKTALTAPQRERLLPLAEAAAKQDRTLFPPGDSQNFNQFSREEFIKAAAQVPEDAVQAVLDPVQWQRWQRACKNPAEDTNPAASRRRGRQVVLQGEAETKEPPAANAEPEEIERFLSDAFEEKAAVERQRQLSALLLKTEDATRVAGLGETAAARLQTAARGTVEAALVPWKANLAQNVRSQMENGDPENVRNLLVNLANMGFGVSDNGQEGQPPSLWDKTLGRELTAPQRLAWQREVEARAAYKDAAIATFALAEFDRRCQISSAQWEKLQPLLLTVMRDYGPDLQRMFGNSPQSPPWYFQSYTISLPLGGIPGDDLKKIVGQDRWDRWSGSPEHATNDTNWQTLQQAHAQRVQGNSNPMTNDQ